MHDRDQDNGNGGGGGGGGGWQKRRQFTDDQARSRRIMNPSMREDCKLRQNEQFKDVFHPGNIRTLTKPKYKNGIEMCIRYHALGFCFGDCKHEKVHGDMDDEGGMEFCQFVGAARTSHAAFSQRRGNNNNNNNNNNMNQDRAPARPTTGTPSAANAGAATTGQ